MEKGEDLIKYIKNEEQSILIRSALEMILNYLRDFNDQHYREIIAALLDDQDVFFHIKHMLVSILAFQEHPSQKEKEIIEKVLSSSMHLSSHFFEQARSREWFEHTADRHIRSILSSDSEVYGSTFTDISENGESVKVQLGYLRHAARNFLSRFVKMKNTQAWELLSTMKDKAIIRSILYDFDDWSYQPAYGALENCGDFMGEDHFGYIHILEKIAAHTPEYSWTRIREHLKVEADNDKNLHSDYEEAELLKKLYENIPEKMIENLEEIVIKNLNWENILDEPLIGDFTFTSTDLKDSEDLVGRQYLYRLLAVCLRRAARKNACEFQNFSFQTSKI